MDQQVAKRIREAGEIARRHLAAANADRNRTGDLALLAIATVLTELAIAAGEGEL